MALTQVNLGMVDTAAAGGLGMRNRIINGAMEINQRGSGVVTANASFPVDRMRISNTNVTKYQVEQSSVAPSGFRNSLLATSLSSYS